MIYSAIVTCFDRNGVPEPGAIRAVTEHNITHSGVDGLFVNGSTGENANMDTDAKKTVLRCVADAANGRARLIAHIGTNVAEEFVQLAQCAADCGYDAVSSVAPIYFGYSQQEYADFFRALAAKSPLPLYIYNIPEKTHVHLTRETFRQLLHTPNIRGVKFTDRDLGLFGQVRTDCPEADLLSGYDDLLLAFTAMGADGTIGTFYNLTGKLARAIFTLTLAGKLAEARAKQAAFNEIMELMCSTGAMIQTVKAVLELYGIPCGECRFPMRPISPVERAIASRAFGLIEENL